MRPLILDYSVERTGEYKSLYQYDDTLSLNVINISSGKIPFIDCQSENINLTTMTKVINESNIENDGYNNSFLEMVTKTRVKQEDDDSSNHLLELSTKTFVKQESDD